MMPNGRWHPPCGTRPGSPPAWRRSRSTGPSPRACPTELTRTRDLVTARVGQVRRLVKQRLTGEINYWDMRYAELLEAQSAGRSLKMKPETAQARAQDLERRLEKRLADLDRDEELIARPPAISAAALVVPQGLLDKLLGVPETARPSTLARDTAETDRRAIAAVLAAERVLGREPTEMAHNNPGYDILSRQPDGHLIYVEVKGRIEGAEEFWVSRTEALHGKNSGHRIPPGDGIRVGPRPHVRPGPL